MSRQGPSSRRRFAAASLLGVAVFAVGISLLVAAATAYGCPGCPGCKLNSYTVHPLVSDLASLAPTVDPNLVNGWGMAAGPTTPWWVSDNGTDSSTLYDGTGTVSPRVFSVPGGPTGIVFNGTTSFKVSAETTTALARFMFATEAGTILGWNAAVPSAGNTHTLDVVDRSGVGAVYKGLAIGSTGGKDYLYATDFHNGRVDVFGGDFALQNWPRAFKDPHMLKGFAPFGIQAIGSQLFVTYAKTDPLSADEVDGRGLGFVDVFSLNGDFMGRVATRGRLNAPWGLAMAPVTGFGHFSGCLLVGNFGDGTINAYAPNRHGDWRPKGTLRTKKGKRLSIDGLWGIGFGNGAASGPLTTLYFAAGPSAEAHGLFGSVTAN